jgi:hypothetical protein
LKFVNQKSSRRFEREQPEEQKAMHLSGRRRKDCAKITLEALLQRRERKKELSV